MEFVVKKYSELTRDELYAILQLRSEIFVVEQDCVYQDIDSKDQKAYHVIGIKDDTIIAYARLFDSGDYFDVPSIGRILVKKEERAFKYGHLLVEKAIQFIVNTFENTSILISAQTYLIKFYTNLGFVQQGAEYLEDGIPHTKMLRV